MPLIFEKPFGKEDSGFRIQESPGRYYKTIGRNMLRETLDLPEVSNGCCKHYTELSRLNFGIDNGFYPLGSYNEIQSQSK